MQFPCSSEREEIKEHKQKWGTTKESDNQAKPIAIIYREPSTCQAECSLYASLGVIIRQYWLHFPEHSDWLGVIICSNADQSEWSSNFQLEMVHFLLLLLKLGLLPSITAESCFVPIRWVSLQMRLKADIEWRERNKSPNHHNIPYLAPFLFWMFWSQETINSPSCWHQFDLGLLNFLSKSSLPIQNKIRCAFWRRWLIT